MATKQIPLAYFEAPPQACGSSGASVLPTIKGEQGVNLEANQGLKVARSWVKEQARGRGKGTDKRWRIKRSDKLFKNCV